MPNARLQTELVELTKDLIRIPSTQSRPEAIQQCGEFIGHWLEQHRIDYQRHSVAGVPSISVLPQRNTVPILLLAHFDVVEADHEELFKPYEKDGALYGRGAIDDKYAVALSLLLFREHLQRLQQQGQGQDRMSFGLLLTGDEEVGGYHGAGEVGKQIDCDFFIAIDGGNPGKIVTREKGIIQLRLKARGRPCHSARPWLGSSAFDLLVDDYRILKNMFPSQNDDHWHDTLVLTNCHVGTGSTNVVPGQAVAEIDIRFTEQSRPDELIENIRAALTSEVIVVAKEPLFNSGESPYLKQLLDHARGAVAGFEHGASDARFLSDRGIHGVVWGADGEMSQHTDDEHLNIASMATIYDCLDNFLLAVEGRANP